MFVFYEIWRILFFVKPVFRFALLLYGHWLPWVFFCEIVNLGQSNTPESFCEALFDILFLIDNISESTTIKLMDLC